MEGATNLLTHLLRGVDMECSILGFDWLSIIISVILSYRPGLFRIKTKTHTLQLSSSLLSYSLTPLKTSKCEVDKCP